MNEEQLKQKHKEESDVFLNAIIELKEELVPELNSIYEECLENEEVNISFKTSFDKLNARHIEFLALTHLKRFLENPNLVKKDVEEILSVPEDLKKYNSGYYILIGLNAIGSYEED